MKSTLRRKKNSSLAVLDVGSSKIACFIAHTNAQGELKVVGIGHQLSKGIRSGVITDLTEAQTSILAAVDAAERMAGETVEDVVVCLSGGGITSRNVMVEMPLLEEEVTDRDMLDIVEQGRSATRQEDQTILHCFPVAYTLDGARGIQDPRQMYGKKLGAELHLITASDTTIRNFTHCLAHCHLNVRDFVVTPHASALACLERDEMHLGVMLLDMGGGTTSYSIFCGGRNVHTGAISVGGSHVTNDIALGLSTSLTHAERLKTLHGSAVVSSTDDHVMIDAPLLGESAEGDESNVMPRAMLVGIIRPRMEEIFELVRSRLEASGCEQMAGRRVVLTGGASQLMGVREMAASILRKQVRLARPKPIAGLAEAVSGPAFSATIGALNYLNKPPLEDQLLQSHLADSGMRAQFRRWGSWLKENF